MIQGTDNGRQNICLDDLDFPVTYHRESVYECRSILTAAYCSLKGLEGFRLPQHTLNYSLAFELVARLRHTVKYLLEIVDL